MTKNHTNNHNYYCIIPLYIMYDKNLKANEKLLYAQISALTNGLGYCFASNGYFAGKNETSKASISSWISSLSKQRHIFIKYDDFGRRCIYINENKDNFNPVRKLEGGVQENLKGGTRKLEGGLQENLNHNTIVNNKVNTKVNINERFLKMYSDFSNFETPKGGEDSSLMVWQELLDRGECEQDMAQGMLGYGDYCNEHQTKTKSVANALKDGAWKDYVDKPMEEIPYLIFSSPDLSKSDFTTAINQIRYTYGSSQYETFIKRLYLTEKGIYAPSKPLGELAKQVYLPAILKIMKQN